MRVPEITAKTPAALLLVLLWIALASGCTGLSGEPAVVSTLRPPPTTPPLVDVGGDPLLVGAQIYAARCTTCHGIGGRGDGDLVLAGQVKNVPDFTDPERRAEITLEYYYEVITNGRIENLMPPWKDALSEQERRAVAEFVYSLADASQVVLAETPASGETIVPVSTPELTPPVATPEVAPSEITPETPTQAVTVVQGSILNGTEGAAPPDALEVILFVINTSREEVFTSVAVAEDGAYRFEDVPAEAAYDYFVSTVYNQVTFFAALRHSDTPASPGEPINLPITVYEVTNDPSVISIDLLLNQTSKRADGALDNLIVARFFNESDRVYREAEPLEDGRYGAVSLNLPDSAIPVGLDLSRYEWSPDSGRVLDTLAVIPDTVHIVHVTYVLQMSDRITYEYVVEYPVTNQPEIMLRPGEFAVDSAQFEGQGVMQFSGGMFEDYLAQPLDARETLRFDLIPVQSTAGASTTASGQSMLGMILAGAGLLLLGGAGGLYISQSRNKPTTESLIAKIAELDLQYQANELSEQAYQQRRDKLKRQLADILRRTKPTQ